MKKKYTYTKGIAVVILLCLALTSCGNVYTWTLGEEINLIQVSDNSDFELMQTIIPENIINVFYGGELEGKTPLGIARIGNGIYTGIPRGGNGRGERIVLYDAEDGIIQEGRVRVEPCLNFWRIIYDDRHERLLWTRHARQSAFQRPPDELIVLDMELRELWRMNIPHYARSFEVLHDRIGEPEHTPFYIMDVAVTDDFYYVVSINNMRQNSNVNQKVRVNPSSNTVTVVYKVDRDGNIVNIFRKENFEFLGIIIQDGFYITYGIQLVDGRAETVIIHGSSDDIFSGKYTVIQAKNLIRHAMIANDTMIITGEFEQARIVEHLITIMDLATGTVVKTMDLTEVVIRYEITLYGIFYGANKDKIGVIGTSSWDESKLGRENQSMMFIPINSEIEIDAVFVIEFGDFRISQIREIYVNENSVTIVCVSWYFHEREYLLEGYDIRFNVIELNINQKQLI